MIVLLTLVFRVYIHQRTEAQKAQKLGTACWTLGVVTEVLNDIAVLWGSRLRIVLKPPLFVVEPHWSASSELSRDGLRPRWPAAQPDGYSAVLTARGFPTMPISADLGSRGTNLFTHKI